MENIDTLYRLALEGRFYDQIAIGLGIFSVIGLFITFIITMVILEAEDMTLEKKTFLSGVGISMLIFLLVSVFCAAKAKSYPVINDDAYYIIKAINAEAAKDIPKDISKEQK